MSGQTEWEDALIKHGVIAAPEIHETEDEKALRLQEVLDIVGCMRWPLPELR